MQQSLEPINERLDTMNEQINTVTQRLDNVMERLNRLTAVTTRTARLSAIVCTMIFLCFS
jgi:prefoldin subunit 5